MRFERQVVEGWWGEYVLATSAGSKNQREAAVGIDLNSVRQEQVRGRLWCACDAETRPRSRFP